MTILTAATTAEQVCEDEAEEFQLAKENLENVEMD